MRKGIRMTLCFVLLFMASLLTTSSYQVLAQEANEPQTILLSQDQENGVLASPVTDKPIQDKLNNPSIIEIAERTGADNLSVYEVILIVSMIILGLFFLVIVGVYSFKIRRAKKEAGQMMSMVQRMSENKGNYYEAIPFQSKDLTQIAFLLQEMNHGYFEDYFTYYLYKWSLQGSIHIHGKSSLGFRDTYKTKVEIFNIDQVRDDLENDFDQLVKLIDKENYDGSFESAIWTMLVEAADKKGFIRDSYIREWAIDHSKACQRLSKYLLLNSKSFLQDEGYFNFKTISVLGREIMVVESSESGENLLNRLVQFSNYLANNELLYFQYNKELISYDQALEWKSLLQPGERVTKELSDLLTSQNKINQSAYEAHYDTYRGAFAFRNAWTSGLTRGGFSSPAAGPALGGGGPTGLGTGSAG